MKNLEKTMEIGLVVLIVILTMLLLNLVQAQKETLYETHSYTRAICNTDNYCQDYYVTCNYDNLIKINPITGAAIQFDSNWSDPRTQEEVNKFCKKD